MVIGNGGSTFLCTAFLIIACFIPSKTLKLNFSIFWIAGKYGMQLRCTNHPFHISVIHIPFLVNALVNSLTLLYMMSQLYYYIPNGYGVVVLVGLLLFVTYMGL